MEVFDYPHIKYIDIAQIPHVHYCGCGQNLSNFLPNKLNLGRLHTYTYMDSLLVYESNNHLMLSIKQPEWRKWRNSLVVKVLDSQSSGPVFKTTGWLQG